MRLLVFLLLLAAVPASAQLTGRAHEPVVIEAALAPDLLGRAPAEIAAFRWTGTDWAAVPVQVDERATIDLGDAFGALDPFDCESVLFCIALTGQVVETFYTDAGTFVGPDPDPALDGDDEIVLLAADAGRRAPASVPDPPGSIPGTRTEVEITADGESAFLYLAAHDGSLDPSAGQDRIRYTFDLLSGDYLTTYDVAGGDSDGGSPVGDALGANPEATTVETGAYALHFSDRWILDGLALADGEGTYGPDLLDRRKVLFAPGDCDRHETTGSRGEGAFVVNRDGPVRALRSVVGFNSGPLVQRTDVFYPDLVVSTTALRVHAIPGVMDLMDYTDAARGMIYRANTASVGVAVDGVPDADVSDGTPLEWETLSGPMGSLLTRHEIETTADGFEPVLYYADDDRNPPRQCTGDGAALGQSGLWIPQSVPSTDPRLGSSTVMRSTRTVLLSPTPLTEAEQDATLAAMASSMTVTVAPVGTSAEADRVVQTRLTVAPNPTAGAATVSFSVTAPTDVRVSVVDALGREVWRAGDRRLGAGPHRVALDLSRLAPGWYAVRVATETSVSTHPLMRR